MEVTRGLGSRGGWCCFVFFFLGPFGQAPLEADDRKRGHNDRREFPAGRDGIVHDPGLPVGFGLTAQRHLRHLLNHRDSLTDEKVRREQMQNGELVQSIHTMTTRAWEAVTLVVVQG